MKNLSICGHYRMTYWAKMRQDDSNEDIKNLKIPKSQYLVMSLIALDG